jgi:hypothetical protein
MGFFHDGESTEMRDMMDQGTTQLFKGFRMMLGLARPAIKNLKAAQARAALQRAAQEMQQNAQSPEAPPLNPGSMPPVGASPDLSPPPRRRG